MSRCFSFPPPGYERKSRVSDEAIIESIKREQDKAEKKRRKEEKREKKERKKKEKKEKKEKSGVIGEVEKKRPGHKDGRANADCKFIDYQNKKEYETEQLEKSGLSEEHGRPFSVPNLCDSSDSTQNSHKRRKHNTPLEGSHNQSTMLRIRLPLVKHKDPEELQSKQQLCSSSGGTETPAHNMADIRGPSLSIKQSCPVSGRTELPTQQCSEPAAAAAAAPLKSSPLERGSLSDAQLRYLIENWVPPRILTEVTDFDDQEWLFDVPSSREPKRCKVSNDASYFESSSLWPRARYLPEVEIYALPYTVPF